MMTAVMNDDDEMMNYVLGNLDASDLEDYSDEDEDEDARDDISVAPSRRTRGHEDSERSLSLG